MHCFDNDTDINYLTIPISAEIFKLEQLGYIDDKKNITPVGKTVLVEIAKITIRQAKDISDEINKNFIDNIEEYKNIFPSGLIKGRRVRTTTDELLQRFKWFFKNYPQYNWTTVLNATYNYIQNLKQQNQLEYCMTSSYFIKKQDNDKIVKSLLASWCDLLEESSQEDDEQPEERKFGYNKLI